MPASGEPIAIWSVSQALWGEETLTIDRVGNARYDFESVEGRPAIHASRRLGKEELDPLAAATRAPSFCALRSARDGIPDEGQPSLRIAMGGSRCTVTLWDGEWEEMTAAQPAHAAVARIIARMKDR